MSKTARSLGVGEVKAAKYAYGNGPLAERAVVLQIVGRIKDKDFPVTWVNTYEGGRYFYTFLGAPDDFQQDSMKRLLVNAVFWTRQRDPENMQRPAKDSSTEGQGFTAGASWREKAT